jgi:uncharacterized protein
MTVISDTSVLSALAEIGLAELIPTVVGVVVVTETVYQECLHPRGPATTRQLLLTATWMTRVADPAQLMPETASLDPGEATSITYACQQAGPRMLLVDDAAARKLCQSLQLPITGTMGILYEAAKLGLIDFDTAIGQLKGTSFRISDAIIAGLRQRLATPPVA